jgi:tetratricopeptide (TPR) repeat protein
MMKQNILSILMIFVVSAAFAQDNKEYMMTMVKQKNALSTAVSEKDFQDLAENFERISKTETDPWHPLYYAALCYINVSFTGKLSEKKDTDLDKAQTFIDKALERYPEESELWVLQGLLYQARIQIDPMKRGKDFSVKANQALSQAKEFNPENPRVYYLLGMNVLHKPKAFGGGPEAACPLFAQASGKFAAYIPENVLLPTWGATENEKLYSENCLNKK